MIQTNDCTVSHYLTSDDESLIAYLTTVSFVFQSNFENNITGENTMKINYHFIRMPISEMGLYKYKLNRNALTVQYFSCDDWKFDRTP